MYQFDGKVILYSIELCYTMVYGLQISIVFKKCPSANSHIYSNYSNCLHLTHVRIGFPAWHTGDTILSIIVSFCIILGY